MAGGGRVAGCGRGVDADWLPGEPTSGSEGWNSQPHPLTSEERRGTGG